MIKIAVHKNNIYSVDMMFAYLSQYEYPITKIKIKELEPNLYCKSWIINKKEVAPIEVLDNKLKYKLEMSRIKNAELKYPIIMYDGVIIDGMHRFTKAFMENRKSIKTCIFNNELMSKFCISNRGYTKKIENMNICDLMILYKNRF